MLEVRRLTGRSFSMCANLLATVDASEVDHRAASTS